MTDAPAPKEEAASIGVLDRAIDLLEVLMAAPSPMSLTELSAEVHLHPSTTYRLLSTLIRRKFVTHDPDTKVYSLSPRLSFPSKGQAAVENLRNTAQPIVRELSLMTGEASSMAIRTGNQAMYITQATSGRVINMFVQIGALVPLHCTGVGKAILAYLKPAEVARIAEAEGLPRFTQKTITDLDSLSQELAKIRQCGYAVDDEEREIGIRCVAAPVFNRDGDLIGAISISGPAGRISPDQDSRLSGLLRASSIKLSAWLE